MNRTNQAENLRRSALRPEAFGDFFDAHFEDLLRYLTRRTCDVEAGLDLTAESFAQAYLSRRRFRGSTDGEAAAWLYRIAYPGRPGRCRSLRFTPDVEYESGGREAAR